MTQNTWTWLLFIWPISPFTVQHNICLPLGPILSQTNPDPHTSHCRRLRTVVQFRNNFIESADRFARLHHSCITAVFLPYMRNNLRQSSFCGGHRSPYSLQNFLLKLCEDNIHLKHCAVMFMCGLFFAHLHKFSESNAHDAWMSEYHFYDSLTYSFVKICQFSAPNCQNRLGLIKMT
jgi:hypothetical protein